MRQPCEAEGAHDEWKWREIDETNGGRRSSLIPSNRGPSRCASMSSALPTQGVEQS